MREIKREKESAREREGERDRERDGEREGEISLKEIFTSEIWPGLEPGPCRINIIACFNRLHWRC